MQQRHKDRTLYFDELAQTSRKYFIPYISKFKRPGQDCRVLEIGCGDGGNLLPFAQMGCYTLGVDISKERIADARKYFADCNAKGDFIASDVFMLEEQHGSFDVILNQGDRSLILCSVTGASKMGKSSTTAITSKTAIHHSSSTMSP